MAENHIEKNAKEIIGRVVSNKGDKSITVAIEHKEKHALYKKYVKKTSKCHAHDEKNECQEGDIVSIRQTRPRSKTKCWELVNVIEKAR